MYPTIYRSAKTPFKHFFLVYWYTSISRDADLCWVPTLRYLFLWKLYSVICFLLSWLTFHLGWPSRFVQELLHHNISIRTTIIFPEYQWLQSCTAYFITMGPLGFPYIHFWNHWYDFQALSYPHHQPQTHHTLSYELPTHNQTNRSAVSIPRSPKHGSPHPPTRSSAITLGKDNEGYLPLLVSIVQFKV